MASRAVFSVYWRAVKGDQDREPLVLDEKAEDQIRRHKRSEVKVIIDGDDFLVPVQPGSVVKIDKARFTPTFLSPRQRKVLWSAAVLIGCCGVFLGMVFVLVVQGWSDADEEVKEDEGKEASIHDGEKVVRFRSSPTAW